MFDFDDFLDWLPYLVGVLHMVVTSATLVWVLMTKPDSTSAVAWGLLIIFLPFVGPVLFYFFGYQHVYRPLKRKRRHKASYILYPRRAGQTAEPAAEEDGRGECAGQSLPARMAAL